MLDRIEALETELEELKEDVGMVKDSRATTTDYGLTKLSTASDVTDANAFALSAIEKNADIYGTLANKIGEIPNITKSNLIYNVISDLNPDYHNKPWILIKERWNEFENDSICIRQIEVGTQWVGIIYKYYVNYGCAILFSYKKEIYLVTKNLEQWEVAQISKSTINF